MPGEIAEAMLDGIFCEGCGEFMGEACGYPRRCAGCREPLKPRTKKGRPVTEPPRAHPARAGARPRTGYRR
jgi:hypothetical protein